MSTVGHAHGAWRESSDAPYFAPPVAAEPAPLPQGYAFELDGPNPFVEATRFELRVGETEPVNRGKLVSITRMKVKLRATVVRERRR